jgi:hypothetical protein
MQQQQQQQVQQQSPASPVYDPQAAHECYLYYPVGEEWPKELKETKLAPSEAKQRFGFMAMKCKKNDVSLLASDVPFKHEWPALKHFLTAPFMLKRSGAALKSTTLEDMLKMLSKLFGYASMVWNVSQYCVHVCVCVYMCVCVS